MPDVSVPAGFAADVVWRNDGAQAYMAAGDATGIHLPTGGMWLFSARLGVNFEGTAGLGGSVEPTGQAQFSPGNSPGDHGDGRDLHAGAGDPDPRQRVALRGNRRVEHSAERRAG
jgi:hypothetical protein